MPANYSVKANTAEEMRTQIVEWANHQASQARRQGMIADRKKTKAEYEAKVTAYEFTAKFFAELTINPKG